MKDEDKTKEQLINELGDLRQQIAELKVSETLRKRSEEALTTTEERFLRIFENTMVGIYQSSPEGRYITVNPAFAHIFGYDSPEELLNSVINIGQQLYVNQEDRIRCIQQLLEQGVHNFEVQVYRKDGSKAWMSNSVRVVRDNNGNIVCFEGIAKDITKRKLIEDELKKHCEHLEELVSERTVELQTAISKLRQETAERKLAEEAARQSEERFKAFMDNSPALAFMKDEELRFIYVNKPFESNFKKSLADIQGKTDFDMWSEETAKHLRENDVIALSKGKAIMVHENVPTPDGFRNWLVVKFPIKVTNRGCFLGGVAIDNTERKRLEMGMARLDRLNLVGQMAAGIGHEIRNPMTTVRGFLQMLGGKKECTRYKEYYDLMIGELDRANSIITEFLSLAKNKAVDLKMHNLNTILIALSPLIQADAIRNDKYIKVILEDIADLPLDEKEIRQLILNLVRNGLEAMPPGGNLNIKTFMDGKEVVLAVQDQGKGIEPDVLEKLGTPFFTTKEQGTGLGLAVCYSIAARLNAKIEIETGSGGTTFFVRFMQYEEKLTAATLTH